jgi:hypothetical protein
LCFSSSPFLSSYVRTTFLRRWRRWKLEQREFRRRRLARRRWLKLLRRFRRRPQFRRFGLQFGCAQLRRIVVARIQWAWVEWKWIERA